MTSEALSGREAVLNEIERIPMLSSAVVELLQLLQGDDDDLDAQAIKAIVEKDPGISARVLSLANSPLYSRGFEIASVDGALSRLGLKKLAKITLEASLQKMSSVDLSGYDLGADGLWTHAVATSIAAKGLVQHLELEDDGSLHAAGLLHNVGRIALQAAFGEQLRDLDLEDDESFADAELRICGIETTDASACLMEHWRLPQKLVDSVRYLQNPQDAPEDSRLAAEVIHLATHISNCGGWGVGRDGTAHRVSKETIQQLNVSAGVIDDVLEETMIEMASWSNGS